MNEQTDLRTRLNAETARLPWRELERHFARGALVTVDPGLDLIEVAASMAEDNTARVQDWLGSNRIRRTLAEEASRWSAEQSELWCVAVAPWVLVQPAKPGRA